MKFDLHVHSSHSGDSNNRIEEVLDACVKKGLSGVAIMDHNSLVGSRYAISLERDDILIIPGMEISSAKGHILAYNVQEEVPRELEVAETIDLIHDQGGIAVAAHPYRMWSGLGEKVTMANDFDAIEIHNGRSTRSNNESAAKLALELCKPFTAGSDSHEPSTVGRAYYESAQDCFNVEDVIREILLGTGTIDGKNRPKWDTISYGMKCITQWSGRGFKKM